MAAALAIWLYGIHVALVEELRGRRLRLTYTAEAIAKYGLGIPLLSLDLPLRPEPYTHGPTRTFLDGLLPEGEPRAALARSLRLPVDDIYGLLEALGRDIAGALVIQPAEDEAPSAPTTLTAEPLTDEGLEDLVRNLSRAPLGAGAQVRVSLGGAQEKLLLTRMPDGRWGRPIDGTPSTHILKPEIAEYPKTVENEHFCMRLAKHLGLRVAAVSMTTIGPRRVLIVERYDRVVHADGSVERIHQEDLCQATGTPPERKYEEDGGPSMRRIAEVVQNATADSLDDLLRALTLTVLVGNGDAHAKNYSLMHERSGSLRLAPVYDVLCTLIYDIRTLAASIDKVQRLDRVTGERLLNEAAGWGMSRRRAQDVVSELLERVPRAAQSARADTPDLPAGIPPTIEAQLARLREGTAAAA